MDIYSLMQRYNDAYNDIMNKAYSLLSIESFNKESIGLVKEYNVALCEVNSLINKFRYHFDNIRHEHVINLEKNLLEYEISDDIKPFVSGDIFSSLGIVEEFLKNGLHIEVLELIVNINVFSNYRSARNVSKYKYPYLKEIIAKQKYPIKLHLYCPFCKQEIIYYHYSKTKPYEHELELKKLMNCNCSLPSYKDDSLLYLEKINLLFSKSYEFNEIELKEDDLTSLKEYARKNYEEFFELENDFYNVYEEEKKYDKHIWLKIKREGFLFESFESFESFECKKIEKIKNALIRGVSFYSLKKVINSFRIKINKKHDYDNGGPIYETPQGTISTPYEPAEVKYKVHPKLVDYVLNYKKAIDNTAQEQQEALGLGHYCNANNIKMKDLDQFISLLHFCKMRNLDLYELKEIVSQYHI